MNMWRNWERNTKLEAHTGTFTSLHLFLRIVIIINILEILLINPQSCILDEETRMLIHTF